MVRHPSHNAGRSEGYIAHLLPVRLLRQPRIILQVGDWTSSPNLISLGLKEVALLSTYLLTGKHAVFTAGGAADAGYVLYT